MNRKRDTDKRDTDKRDNDKRDNDKRDNREDDPSVQKRLDEAAERGRDQEMKVIQLEKEIEQLKASGSSSSDKQNDRGYNDRGQQGMKDALTKGKNMGKDFMGGAKDKLGGGKDGGKNQDRKGQERGYNRERDDDEEEYDRGNNKKDSKDKDKDKNKYDGRR